MPAINLTDRVKAIQYTGSNSAEIDSLITDFVITSESGGVLMFTSQGNPYVANTGDWVRYTQGFVLNTHTTAFMDFAFIHNAIWDDLAPITSDIATLQAQVAGLISGAGVRSVGLFEMPLLAPGSSVHAVPLTVTLPSTTGRTIQARLSGSAALLGTLSITATAFASPSVVNVTVNNSGLLGLTVGRILVTVT